MINSNLMFLLNNNNIRLFRKIIFVFAFSIFFSLYGNGVKYFPNLQIKGESNRSALSYQPGEKMVFTFSLNTIEKGAEKWFLSYIRRGDDGKSFSGKAPADKGLTVITSLNKPGFVSIDVFLVDSKGRRIKRNPNRNSIIGYYAGAAVKAETLKDCGEPKDFDNFWERQKKRLAAVPFLKETQCKLVKSVPNGNVYELSIPCAGPRPATGYMLMPKNAKIKSLPARVDFYGYGARPQTMPKTVDPKYIVIKLNAHGQKLGQSNEYYKAFFESIKSRKYNYAFDPEQNKDPENCFFNGMVLRALRALEYIKTRPEWNGKDLIVSGGSQGGLQTMWAAALDKDVTLATPWITWCCDLAGSIKVKRLDGSWRIKYVEALDYYDPVFMAKRITKAAVHITRAGLGDYTCPPSGLAICYNNLATPRKSIRWVQGSNHGFVPEKSEVVIWKSNH